MGKISILMYHQIGEFERPPAHRSTYCHIRRFKAQMAWLYRCGYQVIGLEEACEVLFEGKPLKGNAVVLTFDDGYQNFYEQAFPVLERYGFPATVFLVADLLGKTSEWLAADGRPDPPLMDISIIRQLRRKGVLFGAHTLSHPRLSQIDHEQMCREVKESKRVLEELLDEKVDYFCYPCGDFDAGVVAAVKDAGYRGALSCIRASAEAGKVDPFLIPRKAISFGDSLAGFWWKIHMKHKPKQSV